MAQCYKRASLSTSGGLEHIIIEYEMLTSITFYVQDRQFLLANITYLLCTCSLHAQCTIFVFLLHDLNHFRMSLPVISKWSFCAHLTQEPFPFPKWGRSTSDDVNCSLHSCLFSLDYFGIIGICGRSRLDLCVCSVFVYLFFLAFLRHVRLGTSLFFVAIKSKVVE